MDRTALWWLRTWALGALFLATVEGAMLLKASEAPGPAALSILTVTASGVLALLLFRDVPRLSLPRAPRAPGAHALYALMATAHEGLWLLDASGATVFANARLAAMLGLDESRLRGRCATDFLAENSADDLATVLAPGAFRSGIARDLCYRRADGQLGWAIVSGRPADAGLGLPEGTLLLLTDITERKKAELALAALKADLETRIRLRTADLTRANEQLRTEMGVRLEAELAKAESDLRLHEIMSTLPIALFLKDPTSRITMMNAACEEAFGVPLEHANAVDQRLPPGLRGRYLQADQRAFRQRGLVTSEEPIWNHTREEFRRHVTYKKPVFHPDGSPAYLICLSVDIEERKRTEEALASSLAQLRQLTGHLETIKDEERRRIASLIHDDLGQNLLALKLEVGQLHIRTAHHPTAFARRVAGAVTTIDASLRAVRSIINDLHPSTLELGLVAALEWLLGRFRMRSDVATTLNVSGGEGEDLDRRITSAIFRAVEESLNNVQQHAAARNVRVRLNIYHFMVGVTVEDDGSGIRDKHPRGFGLRGIHERARALNGWVKVDSTPGVGTRLRMMLPRVLPVPDAGPEAEVVEDGRPGAGASAASASLCGAGAAAASR
ncbi:PAS domain-containing sensor histidine kinase [Zemynaea arenosa]|uniref:PAS domain-containing sensor histidine kinase n=1 Tax=Zemynaea arenosa TaxID=2561931 RepID=UPI001430344B|nr:PAS domain S-box protein [Massilia arenosa]